MKLRWRELSEYHLPQKLLQHIDKVTERHHDYRDNIFYVSELTGCIRQAYLNRTLKPKIEDYDFTQKWRLFRGIIFDQAITTLFERNQIRITHRVKNLPIVITGKADFIEDDVLWELKTVSELPEKPQEHHVLQVLFYAYYLLPKSCRILYVAMDNVRVFEIDYNDELARQAVELLEERAKTLYECLRKNEPPEPTKNRRLCESCFFYLQDCVG